MDGSLKRFPLSPPPSLPAPLFFFFFSYSSNNRILSSSPPPDLTYLNPILNLANAYLFAMAIRGMYASFARYSVAETSTGDTSRCIGYLHSPSWSENYVPPRREPHTQMELWIFLPFHLISHMYLLGRVNGKLFEGKYMRSCRCTIPRCLRLFYVNGNLFRYIFRYG